MKLLAQFYACLAFILFVAMIGSFTEAYSNHLMAAGEGRDQMTQEQHPHPQPPQQINGYERVRRQAPDAPKQPEKPSQFEQIRTRRQLPDGAPNPQDLMNKMPMPPQGGK